MHQRAPRDVTKHIGQVMARHAVRDTNACFVQSDKQKEATFTLGETYSTYPASLEAGF